MLLSRLSQQRKVKPIATVLVWQSLPAMLARRAGAQRYRLGMRPVLGGELADDLVVFRGQQGTGDLQKSAPRL